MIEPPQTQDPNAPVDPNAPQDPNAQQGPPQAGPGPQPSAPTAIDQARADVTLAISAVAKVLATAKDPQEVKDTGQGLQAACQGLLAISPSLSPKSLLPNPQSSPPGKSQLKGSRPGAKAT